MIGSHWSRRSPTTAPLPVRFTGHEELSGLPQHEERQRPVDEVEVWRGRGADRVALGDGGQRTLKLEVVIVVIIVYSKHLLVLLGDLLVFLLVHPVLVV